MFAEEKKNFCLANWDLRENYNFGTTRDYSSFCNIVHMRIYIDFGKFMIFKRNLNFPQNVPRWFWYTPGTSGAPGNDPWSPRPASPPRALASVLEKFNFSVKILEISWFLGFWRSFTNIMSSLCGHRWTCEWQELAQEAPNGGPGGRFRCPRGHGSALEVPGNVFGKIDFSTKIHVFSCFFMVFHDFSDIWYI